MESTCKRGEYMLPERKRRCTHEDKATSQAKRGKAIDEDDGGWERETDSD